jgi:uncharacterized protein YkwD
MADDELMSLLATIFIALILPPAGTWDDPVSAALIAAHNRERAERKLPPLVPEARLTEAARLHAVDMASHRIMTHDGTDGSTPADRVKRQKYTYLTTGENVARGQRSVDDVMTGWMNSPHHRENILGDFKEIGVARVEDDEGKPYWCVVFGSPFPRLDPSKAESELAERLNHARGDADKPALRVDPRLAQAARAIARDLAANGSLKPDDKKDAGPTATDRVKQSGYRFETLSQGGAFGSPTPETVLKSLLESPDQKAALFGPFTDLGVGYALADDGRPFWCLLMAKPLR